MADGGNEQEIPGGEGTPPELSPEIAEALGLRYVTLARWRKEALGVFTLAR